MTIHPAKKLDAYYVWQNPAGGISFATPSRGHIWADTRDNDPSAMLRIAKVMASKSDNFPLRNESPPNYERERYPDGQPLEWGRIATVYMGIGLCINSQLLALNNATTDGKSKR